jgi:hypothetical protein
MNTYPKTTTKTWLNTREMADRIGLHECTPAPRRHPNTRQQ